MPGRSMGRDTQAHTLIVSRSRHDPRNIDFAVQEMLKAPKANRPARHGNIIQVLKRLKLMGTSEVANTERLQR